MGDALWFLWKKFLIFFGRLRISILPPMVYYAPENYLVTGDEKQLITKFIRRGDILLRKRFDYVDDWFLPGFFSHAAIYIGRGKIIHAIEKGVVKDNLLDFLHADAVVVLRHKHLTKEEINGIISKAMTAKGCQYDFSFNFGEYSRFSCTELVYFAFEKFLNIYPKKYLFKKLILPDDFFWDCNLDLVFASSIVSENGVHIKNRFKCFG